MPGEETGEGISRREESEWLNWLLCQYQQGAEEYRHEDRISFQVFLAAVAANGVIATLLADALGKPQTLRIVALASFFGFALSAGCFIIILRSQIYQSHRAGILSEIESWVGAKNAPLFNLYHFHASDPKSFSKLSSYYNLQGRKGLLFKVATFGGRRTSLVFLAAAAFAWVVTLAIELVMRYVN